METIKKLIIVTALASALSPVASVCAADMDIDDMDIESDNEVAAAAQPSRKRRLPQAEALSKRIAIAPPAPMTPEQIAEQSSRRLKAMADAAKIRRFRAGRIQELSAHLPIQDTSDIILDYAAQTDEQLAQVNKKLIDAVRDNDLPAAIAALNDGACTETPRGYDGLNPLQKAANEGYCEMAKVLLDNNANANNTQGWDDTPLHFAAYFGRITTIQLLLEHKADVNIKNRSRLLPLAKTFTLKQAKAAEILVAAGSNTDLVDRDGKTVWQYAEDNPKMLQALRKGLALLSQKLSTMLLTTNILQQYVQEHGVVRLVNDYAAQEPLKD